MLIDKNSTQHQRIKELRLQGLTFSEINGSLGLQVPKSTMSYICKNLVLSDEALARIHRKAKLARQTNQRSAVTANSQKFEQKLKAYREDNEDIKNVMLSSHVKLISLAMLYLGEGAKWKSRRGPMLASSDPNIIRLYLRLVDDCYRVDRSRIRLRIQHRVDQKSVELIDYWTKITGIPKNQFYPCYIDKRTLGKITKKTNYKGVCSVTHPGTHIQLELQEIAGIISKALGC